MIETNVYDAVASLAYAQLLGIVFVLLFLMWGFIWIFEISKSKKYRKYIADMYVAGKIRQFAEEDKISLEGEAVNFKAWCKTQSIKDKPLDEIVEDELKERVGLEEKINKRKEK